jgi:hypothetical protein
MAQVENNGLQISHSDVQRSNDEPSLVCDNNLLIENSDVYEQAFINRLTLQHTSVQNEGWPTEQSPIRKYSFGATGLKICIGNYKDALWIDFEPDGKTSKPVNPEDIMRFGYLHSLGIHELIVWYAQTRNTSIWSNYTFHEVSQNTNIEMYNHRLRLFETLDRLLEDNNIPARKIFIETERYTEFTEGIPKVRVVYNLSLPTLLLAYNTAITMDTEALMSYKYFHRLHRAFRYFDCID